LVLADTGLRISEACALRRGDIDWNEGQAIIIGKGDKQAPVRFSNRSMRAMQDYLAARSELDGASGKPLTSLPIFVRHDKGAGKKVKPVKTGGMWYAIKGRMREAGEDPKSIRIHDFRHYFVTMVQLAGGDIRITQELARHASIATTSRYAHIGGKADELYNQVFNEDAR
jgi:site-specific recombinase XerD